MAPDLCPDMATAGLEDTGRLLALCLCNGAGPEGGNSTAGSPINAGSPNSAIDVNSDEECMVDLQGVHCGCTLSLVHKACTPCR